jgi:hypothetical protein
MRQEYWQGTPHTKLNAFEVKKTSGVLFIIIICLV